jgi:hypothetical protein
LSLYAQIDEKSFFRLKIKISAMIIRNYML